MSIAVLVLGALHALPIVLVGAKTKSMPAVLLCAIAVSVLAIFLGSARFIFVDLLGVVIGTFIGRSFCNLPKVRSPSFNAESFGKDICISADADRCSSPSEPVTICGVDPALPNSEMIVERNELGEFESYQAAAQHAHMVAKLSGQVMTVRSSGQSSWLVERSGEFQPKLANMTQSLIDAELDLESKVIKVEMMDDQTQNSREPGELR